METDGLIVREIPGKGRGAFAARRYAVGDVIEEAPVIVLPDPQWQELEKTELKNYYFNWSDTASALVMGAGELYNYSVTPNAKTVRDVSGGKMQYVAVREIQPGEEITIRYQCEPWFKVVE